MSTADAPFPTAIDAVTPEWLAGVVGAPVRSIDPVRIGEGVGIMGEIYRVALGYADRAVGPASVVVKLPSSFEANRAQGIALGMYEAEVRFYNELAPQAPSGLPQVLAASIVPGTADFVIVMEDLSHLDQVEQAVGMTPAQARAAVEALADIHAAWWGKVDVPALAWIPSIVHDRIRGVDALLGTIWPGFAASFADALPDGGVALGERFSASYFALMERYSSRPWTLLHQDYRVENMLFGAGPAGEGIVVIDWQGLGRGPGGYDLAYILGGSMPIDDRRAHERELVGAYRDRLASRGVERSADDLWDDYRHGMLLGGLATTVFAGGTLDTANERGRALVASMAERHFTAALDHGGLALFP
jgi:hypothetical protein